jgi:steroid delta-isomerase-like uncharacterized protein
MLATLSKLPMIPSAGTLIAATSASVELNAREPPGRYSASATLPPDPGRLTANARRPYDQGSRADEQRYTFSIPPLGGMMSQSNKQLAERFHDDIFVAGKLDVADEILSRDFVAHGPVPPEFARGPGGVKQWATSLRGGFPDDLWIKHHQIIAEGDLVMVRWESGGTHRGELFGIPATGKTTNVTGLDLFRIKDGKIAELWQEWNVMDYMQQLGALPPA